MRRGCLGRERWRSAIVSSFSGRVGPLFGELRRVELVGLGEENSGRGKMFEIYPDALIHFIEFMDLCCKFLAFVQSIRRVVARLGVIRVGVYRTRTGC